MGLRDRWRACRQQVRRRAEGRLVPLVAMVALAGAGASLSACSSVQQAVEAPVNAIGATDVVVQNNLEAALQAAETEFTVSESFSSFGSADSPSTGNTLTPDPSRGPKTISYGVTQKGQVLVLAAYNPATENCYGLVQIAGTALPPVLGETGQGTYDFTDPHILSTGCDAGLYMSAPAPLKGWPPGDPEVGGWPK